MMADVSSLVWRRSSFSGGNGGTECVEVALPVVGAVVRDSKDPDGAVLSLPRAAWVSLLGSLSPR
jgi:hypothetical protein